MWDTNCFQLIRDKYAHTRSSSRTNKEHQILIYEIWDCLNETALIQCSYHCQYPRALQHSVTIFHIVLWKTMRLHLMLSLWLHMSGEKTRNRVSKNRPSGLILSISRNVCMSVCPSHFLTPFTDLFALIFWSPMSKLFRFLKSLGGENGKKLSPIWKLLLMKGVKSPRHN